MNTRTWKTDPGEILGRGPVIPVMVIRRTEDAVPLAKALLAGGVSVLEITLRTDAALDAIREIVGAVPEAVVGAGTVLTPGDLELVEDAGGAFAISPGLTPELLDAANVGALPLIPGISTVSELMAGMARGYTHFKFFPAEPAGGTAMLNAIAGPFPKVRFCPTGGISEKNYRDYLALGNVACVGGSWIVPSDAVETKDWDRITRLARESIQAV